MPKLFSWPIKPHQLTQGWGTYNPAVYSQFGFTRHNGLDHVLAMDRRIYAPCDGTIIINDNQPKGGGIYMALLSDHFLFPYFLCTTPDRVTIPFREGLFAVRIDFLHLEKSLVATGFRVKQGDLIAFGDNTGFSTGPHCHTQWRRVLDDGNNTHADTNDANNSFDPTQFFDGFYAVDYQTTVQKLQELLLVLKAKIQALKGS